MAQVESSLAQLDRLGASVVFIAAQKREGLFRGKQHVESHQYPFPILFDEDRSVTKTYGVHHMLGVDAVNIARRSTFLVDREGRIQWIAVSPSQFVAPGVPEMLQAIESCGKC